MPVAPPSFRQRTWFLTLVAMVLSVACAAGGSDGGEPDGTSDGGNGGGTATSGGGDGMLPLGAAWETISLGRYEGYGRLRGMTEAGGRVWVMGIVFNQPMLWQSSDGVTWTETALPGRDDGEIYVYDIVQMPEGRLVVSGSLATRCRFVDTRGAYQHLDSCRRQRPVFYLSDDDGATWRRSEPPTMAPPEDHSLVIEGITLHDGVLVAGTTVRGPDWHGRIYSSTDAETWTLDTQVRGDDEPWSVEHVLSDNETLVVLASAHVCSKFTDPTDISQAGWVLGTGWAHHLRILAGNAPASVRLLTLQEHPLAAAPMDVDCEEVSPIELNSTPYARADGAVIGGRITLLEHSAEEDDREASSYARRVVTLVDGSWKVQGVMDLPRVLFNARLVDLGGVPALMNSAGTGDTAQARMRLWRPEATGTWVEETSVTRLLQSRVEVGAAFGDTLLAAGVLHDEPFDRRAYQDDPGEFLLWRSVPVAADRWFSCEFTPGANCRGIDLAATTDRVDFSGMDLSGIDFTLADLASGVFDGANLSGARLVAASGWLGSFVSADLTGADLRGADLPDMAGANLTNANLEYAEIEFSAPPASLEGASLIGVELNIAPG